MFHFFAVGLSYATNWRRSAVQDELLTWLQPYLITGNWYQEMLPIGWISDPSGSGRVRVLVQMSNESKEWKQVLDASEKGVDHARLERLHHVLAELAGNEDTLGLTVIVKSMVVHLESVNQGQNNLVARVRLEKNSEQTLADANELDSSATELESVLYEAEVVRFEGGEFGFIPKVESHRSVRSLKSSAVPK